jgi:hypothetical protein
MSGNTVYFKIIAEINLNPKPTRKQEKLKIKRKILLKTQKTTRIRHSLRTSFASLRAKRGNPEK